MGLSKLAPGIWLYQRVLGIKRPAAIGFYQLYILSLTYLLYVTYHLSRRPLSVVKNVLHRNCTLLPTPANISLEEIDTWCQWGPFDQQNYQELYASLDFAYWMAYAVGMFLVGSLAERTNQRYFVSIGMISAGFWTVAFGMAYIWKIHHFSYFLCVQIFGGVLQATGWPVMVTLVGNWFGKKRRGLVFGIWNSHSSVGNIIGALLASVWVDTNWSLSFIVPGVLVAVGGIFAFLFIIVRPEDAGFPSASVSPAPPKSLKRGNGEEGYDHELQDFISKDGGGSILQTNLPPADAEKDAEEKPVAFWHAVKIPGVIEFASCLFFAKAVSYVFLVWLPVYIRSTAGVGNDVAGYLSAIFDCGGVVGGILAGGLSDLTGARGLVSGTLALCAVPIILLVLFYGSTSLAMLITLLVLAGITVVGPYALITTAVSADLGSSLKGKSKALSTVTGIINGTGSFGAAVGPLIAGLIASNGGWPAVFYFLVGAQLVAALCLSRIVYREIKGWSKR